ncbi:RagB/SusD family nutrient uptake outer membrane protein [Arsenicibacter rosenii]|uniref:RagB/SusD family nutrient uptake outer membrane protein n=1 Tax=Arsenicibacter rosenii TaxID=1750698 RepID=A0A1S2VE17_9BACT|nr:RagB/SusD family nutrient uptake outer membrane protein [Arsenicibacter rosenii]OIN56942.1 RagB/SusD family nutrient uptake outer membrane protein [Arsenicibacter rosenii]
MKKITVSLLLLSGVFATSCSDKFLDVQPKAALSSTALQNKAGVNALLIGAYALLDGWATPEGAYRSYQVGADNWVYGSVASDDAYKGTIAGDQPPISLIEQGNIQSDNIYFRGKWRGMYDGIARTNDVLQVLALAKDLTDAEAKQVIAEARFLRGHYHFELKKMYNNVVYIDEKTYDPNNLESTKLPNTTDIWPKIVDDLKAAYDVLPAKQTQVGRPTKWAAAADLAKAYLYQKKYAEAKTLLEAIVASNQYKLMDRYHDNFKATTNNNTESIFEIQYSVNDGASGGENGNAGSTLNYPYGGGGVTTCCGFFQPSQNLVNAFKTDANGLPLPDTFNADDVKNDQGIESTAAFTPETRTLDPRLDWTVGRRGIPYLDWGVHPGKAYVRDQAYGGPYSPKKHVMYRSDVGTNTFAGNPRLNANNYRLIRYSHVLLWLAEIEVEIGDLEKARGYVNQIRRRAANPDGWVKNADGTPAANYLIKEYTAAWTDKAAARKAVQFEQRLEFAMEGHRRFDLVRWGIADQVLNTYYSAEAKKRSYLNGVQFVKGKHEYFPIPLQEILNSQKDGKPTLTQNPGY